MGYENDSVDRCCSIAYKCLFYGAIMYMDMCCASASSLWEWVEKRQQALVRAGVLTAVLHQSKCLVEEGGVVPFPCFASVYSSHLAQYNGQWKMKGCHFLLFRF